MQGGPRAGRRSGDGGRIGGAPGSLRGLTSNADQVVYLQAPEMFFAIGQFYADFAQVPDQGVVDCLARAGTEAPDTATASTTQVDALPPARDEEVDVRAGTVLLPGHLHVPAGAAGVVLFVHGSGSSRHSPRNRFVAAVLHEAGLGTLLFDLLTPREELDQGNVFDIGLLADRLTGATRWLREQAGGQRAAIGYFGASTGAAAALWAEADPDADVDAVVSRGGRPDLAGARLAAVRAPTLLIVGGDDRGVLELNRRARMLLQCVSSLAVIPAATHLFEEPGTLHQAAGLARDWFVAHLKTRTARRAGSL